MSHYEYGTKYGKVTLTGFMQMQLRGGKMRRCVEARCECGVVKMFELARLKSGETRSCGCYQKLIASHNAKRRIAKHPEKHGLIKHPLYSVYSDMRQRCYNPKKKDYPRYGGRGINVCDEWRESFIAFYDWGVANGYKEGLTLDRIDNAKGYSPDNCRFTTVGIQNRNTRQNRLITAWGETKCVKDWAFDPRAKVGYWTLRSRVDSDSKRWGSMEERISSPQVEKVESASRQKSNTNLTAWGETKHVAAWMRDERCKVVYTNFKARLEKGMTVEEALSAPAKTVRLLTAWGETKGFMEWVRDNRCKAKAATLKYRLQVGWDAEKAISSAIYK